MRCTMQSPFIASHANVGTLGAGRVYPTCDDGKLYPAYSVSWLPKGGGPSPEFVGTLTVEKRRRDDCFGLILSGRYKPLGASSGVARGNRIARMPASGVLRPIADYVLETCAYDEAALAGHSRYVSQ
jgi:hypothetical protein